MTINAPDAVDVTARVTRWIERVVLVICAAFLLAWAVVCNDAIRAETIDRIDFDERAFGAYWPPLEK